jgi:serine/threonine-protein kinase
VQLPVALPGSTSGGGPALAIAPDGSAIAFSGRGLGQNQLYIHRLSDATTTTIRGPANPFSPVFSPDGAWVAFGVNPGTATATIWRASAKGGDADPFCGLKPGESVGVRGFSWSEDGRVVFGSTVGLFEASAAGGSCQLALSLDGKREARFLWPQVLPHGRGTLLTVSGVSDDADSASIVVVPAGTQERRVIVRDARAGRLTKSGHLVFARGHQIFAAPFDLDRLTTTADPVMVVEGVASGQFGGPLLDISDSGDLVYVPGRETGNRLVWVTRNGARSDAGAPRRSYVPPPVLSPDGRSVAVSIGTADHFLWLYSLSAGTMTPLTRHDTHAAVWSPDSRKVSFPMEGIAVTNRESTGEPEMVLKGQGVAAAWSPDGMTMMYNRRSADGGDELSALSLRDRTTRTILRARERILGAQFSPDGRWLAYASNESGRLEVYVTDFPAAQSKKQVSTDGGSAPVWARNGRELFYVSGSSMMTAAVRPGALMQFERPIRLFDGIQFPGPLTPYSVSPDGRFLFVEEGQPNTTERSQLTLVLSWISQLKRLVPIK